jgi:two-component system LytT family response regulator
MNTAETIRELNSETALERNLRIERPQRKIALPTLEGIHFEKIKEIVQLEANGNYTFIHLTNNRKILVSKTLAEVENKLHHHPRFVRVHRSNTINLDLLIKYVRGKGGYVEMENGAKITVSTARKQSFLSTLERYFG